ncbi:MAG: NAD-dependent epimerase/dehydratase family protein [Planctomycetes bacterium]|nr:NAD-dependent epimerase/dehydratase family protein [Planctomycetota bacterium]
MSIVITGGAGFIGSMLCKLLVERSDDIVVIDNLLNGRRELIDVLGSKARLLEVDIRNTEAVRKIIKDIRPQGVCHLAAIHFIPYCNQYPLEALDINVQGTLSVLEACKAAPPEMVVVASTAAVYGIGDKPCKEMDSPDPLDIYGISKNTCEQLARLYSSDTGAPCISARIFNAVGPNETNLHFVPQLINQLIRGERTVELGNLEPRRDYIHTSDLARGLMCALDHKQDGYNVFNIGTGDEHSVKDIVEMCETILGQQIEIRQSPHLTRKVDRMHLCASIDKIRGIMGWEPKVKIEHTLRELLEAGIEYATGDTKRNG